MGILTPVKTSNREPSNNLYIIINYWINHFSVAFNVGEAPFVERFCGCDAGLEDKLSMKRSYA